MKAIPGGVDAVTHPNAKANKAMHKIHGGGSPKDTSHGMDLSGNATNCIGGKPGLTRAESANSKAASRNQ